MFHWSGMETTNDVNVANYEHHVTGDVAYALEQYLYMTQDLDFLKYERGAELVEAIADFWVSRVVRDDKTNKYVIRGQFICNYSLFYFLTQLFCPNF